MFRWFADLPIERKLRVVITVPAMAAFAIAMVMHVATNLLHLRAELQQRAAGIARGAGVSVIEALRPRRHRGRRSSALARCATSRWWTSRRSICRTGKRSPRYDRAANERAAGAGRPTGADRSARISAGQFQITAPAAHEGAVLGYVHILVPLAALYPDWRELCHDHRGCHRRRHVDFLLARGAAAEADLRARSSIWRTPCNGSPPRRTTACGSSAAPRTRSAR